MRRTGEQMVRKAAALAAPAALLAIVLLVHGAVSRGHHTTAPMTFAQVSTQAQHLIREPAEKGVGHARGIPVPDGCPQPAEHCAAAVQTMIRPLPGSGGLPFRGFAGMLVFLAAMLAAYVPLRLRAGQMKRHSERPSRIQLQLFRC
jgi:hypothetical protein